MSAHVVKKSITINAKPAKVWDALTNPEKTKEYFFNCEVHSSWQKGSPITFKGKIFLIKNIEMTGSILEIEPQKLLKYNLKNQSDNDGSFSTITDELTYENGVTTVSITDDVGTGPNAEDHFRKSDKGWDKVLKGLKELVEKENSQL